MENISGADIRTTLVVIAAFVALAVAVLTLVAMIRKERERAEQPYIRIKSTVEDHDKRITKLEAASDINSVENKLMMKMQLALVRHAIDGNNISNLKSMQEEVQLYLIDK